MFSAIVIQKLLGESIIRYLSSLHMAIKSTIYKAHLAIANIDLGYYADHSLTLARHPSETDERMMVRLIALALQAHQIQTVCQGDGMIAFGARSLRSSRNRVISKVPFGTSVPSISEIIAAIRCAKWAPRVGIPKRTMVDAP